jgi:hypothetical protein
VEALVEEDSVLEETEVEIVAVVVAVAGLVAAETRARKRSGSQ